MEIEEPEEPLDFKAAPMMALAASGPEFYTIGQFYTSIKQNLKKLVDEEDPSDPVFSGDPARQFHRQKWFPDEATPVSDLRSAFAAIDRIISQGEGGPKSPLDQDQELAHYYRFAEIARGRKLIRVSKTGPVEKQWDYDGDPVPLDETGIYPLRENAHLSDYPENSAEWVKARQFDYSYTGLLRALHRTFNGDPSNIDVAMGLMFTLTIQAQSLVQVELDDGTHAAPPFEYQATLD